MSKEIIVDINDYQTRVATLENTELVEIYVERAGRERIVGNIYKGRVQNVLPGMQAAFVDIGLEKNAFLYAGDILAEQGDFEFDGQEVKPEFQANINDLVKPRQEIILQVLKEPVGTKGARVTTHITLPCRTLVLMPTVNYIGVSRRIEDEGERDRLRSIVEKIKPDNMGVIVRTAAEGKLEEEFLADINFLVRLWDKIQNKAAVLSAPRRIHGEESLVFRTIRDMFSEDIDKLIINEQQYFEKLKIIAGIISPKLVERLEYFDKPIGIFDFYEIESRIEKLLSRKVWLKNGGYIVIDATEALTCIDVNTGKYVGNDDLQETLFETNCEAAKEIARQLRLRDIGGIIIIDFIDMEFQPNKDALLDLLRDELKKDRTKSNVIGMTGLGLVEMTRKKMRKSFSATMQAQCPYCKGEGKVQKDITVALAIRRSLQREILYSGQDVYLVEAHPAICSFIEASQNGSSPVLIKEPGKTVYVRSVPYMHIEDFKISAIKDIRTLDNEIADSKLFC